MMQQIEIYELADFPEKPEKPYIVIGQPCAALLKLQQEGVCVLAELTHLQGLSEEEVAEALCREEAVTQYEHICLDASQLPQAYFRRVWCKHIGEPVSIAETTRLLIRESRETDAEAFYQLYQDEACRKYLQLPPVAVLQHKEENIAAYERYIREYREGQYAFYEYGMWSVIEKESGSCIGRAGLELQPSAIGNDEGAEGKICLGYAILPQHRGYGYAVEACDAILSYCEECAYTDEVYVQIEEDNRASYSVYDRLKSLHKKIKCVKINAQKRKNV